MKKSLLIIIVIAGAVFTGLASGQEGDSFFSPNVGGADRVIRLVVGVAAVGAGGYFAFSEEESWGYIPFGVGFVPLLTGALAWCPLYYPLGINTKRKSQVSLLLTPRKGAGLKYSYTF